MQPLQEMLNELRGKVLSPERKEVVVALATDLAQLTSRSLAGEDVEKELKHVRSQGEMLSAAEIGLVRNTLLDWLALITASVVRGALAGL